VLLRVFSWIVFVFQQLGSLNKSGTFGGRTGMVISAAALVSLGRDLQAIKPQVEHHPSARENSLDLPLSGFFG